MDDIVIGCLTITEMPVPYEPGSTSHPCDGGCGALVWCGPSTIQGVVKRFPLARIRMYCLACATNLEIESVNVLPESIEAVRQWEADQ